MIGAGVAAVGASVVFTASYGLMSLLPISETPHQDGVRACAELLDASTLDEQRISYACDQDAIWTETVTNDSGSRSVSTIYPTGNQYIAIKMPAAKEADADRSFADEHGYQLAFAGMMTFMAFAGVGIYGFYRQHKDTILGNLKTLN